MKRFIQIYYDFLDYKDDVSLEDAGKLLWAMVDYGANGTLPNDASFNHGTLKMLWKMQSRQIDRDSEQYAKKCKRNKENAIKRWEQINKSTPKPTIVEWSQVDEKYDELYTNIGTCILNEEPNISNQGLDKEIKNIITEITY